MAGRFIETGERNRCPGKPPGGHGRRLLKPLPENQMSSPFLVTLLDPDFSIIHLFECPNTQRED